VNISILNDGFKQCGFECGNKILDVDAYTNDCGDLWNWDGWGCDAAKFCGEGDGGGS
jgi:hypothetical protein